MGAARINPLVSAAVSAPELASDVSRGNYGGAAIDALGMLPAVQAGRRLVQAARGTLPSLNMAQIPTRTVDPATGVVNDELLNNSRAAYGRIAQAPIEYHPAAIEDFSQRAQHYLQQPGARGVFTPESAPGVFNLLDRRVAELQQRGVQSLAPYDFDVLRQQLRSFPSGADSAAGQRAAAILDNYMSNPPPGAITRMAPGAMGDLRANMAIARGDWRAGKTAETVEQEIDRAGTRAGGAHSGLNVDNATRQRLSSLTSTDAGEQKIFGATWPERQAINAVVEGDPLTNKLRYVSNRMGGGGGFTGTFGGGIAGHTVNALLGSWGVDPVTATAAGMGVGYGWPKIGEQFRQAANERTVRAAGNVVDQIRQNSPLYQARQLAAGPPITDPRAMARDAIAYALMPQLQDSAKNAWDQAHVPYSNQEQP
jgi:hypothetical protein